MQSTSLSDIIFIVNLNDKMIIYEAKLEGDTDQYQRLDAAIRTGRFVRNSVIRAWLDK